MIIFIISSKIIIKIIIVIFIIIIIIITNLIITILFLPLLLSCVTILLGFVGFVSLNTNQLHVVKKLNLLVIFFQCGRKFEPVYFISYYERL